MIVGKGALGVTAGVCVVGTNFRHRKALRGLGCRQHVAEVAILGAGDDLHVGCDEPMGALVALQLHCDFRAVALAELMPTAPCRDSPCRLPQHGEYNKE